MNFLNAVQGQFSLKYFTSFSFYSPVIDTATGQIRSYVKQTVFKAKQKKKKQLESKGYPLKCLKSEHLQSLERQMSMPGENRLQVHGGSVT